MVKVTKIIYSGGFCPYQLEALSSDGREIYLRYRGGYLRWGFVDPKSKFVPDHYEFSEKIGDDYDGGANDKVFKEILKDQLEFPEGFTFDGDVCNSETMWGRSE
jgi:hypothetical protein